MDASACILVHVAVHRNFGAHSSCSHHSNFKASWRSPTTNRIPGLLEQTPLFLWAPRILSEAESYERMLIWASVTFTSKAERERILSRRRAQQTRLPRDRRYRGLNSLSLLRRAGPGECGW